MGHDLQRYEDSVPSGVRRWIEELLGGPATGAVVVNTGANPESKFLLSRFERAVFVKSASEKRAPGSAVRLHLEQDVLEVLPTRVPAPRLLGTADTDHGFYLIVQGIIGDPVDLVTPRGITRAVAAVHDLAAELCSVRAPGLRALRDSVHGWATRLDSSILSGTSLAGRSARQFRDLGNLDRLMEALVPDQICHWDIRADNMIVRRDSDVVFVDWGSARLGPRWADSFRLAMELPIPAATRYLGDISRASDATFATIRDFALLFAFIKAFNYEHVARPGLRWDRAAEHHAAETYWRIADAFTRQRGERAE